jgi:hypothetical protein
MFMERRKNKRITVNLPVHYAINQEARAINLSPCGIRLETKKFLTKGTILFLNIFIPGEELKAIGEVRWGRSSNPGKFEIGVEFFFMDSIYEKKIQDYIKTLENLSLTIQAERN